MVVHLKLFSAACAYIAILVSKINPDVLRVGYSALQKKGKLEPIDLATMIFTETEMKHEQKLKEIIDTLKAYPKEYDFFKNRLDQILESLGKLKEMTQKTFLYSMHYLFI